MADESRTTDDATVVMGAAVHDAVTEAGAEPAAMVPAQAADDATVLSERPATAAPPAGAAATVVAAAPVQVSSTAPGIAAGVSSAGASASFSSPNLSSPGVAALGTSQRFAAAPAPAARPLWLAVSLGVACGLALFAVTALLLRG